MLNRFLSRKIALREPALVAKLTKRGYGRHTLALITRTERGLFAVDPSAELVSAPAEKIG